MAKSTRLIPAQVFVAESLEHQADLLPPGSTEEAVILRQAANIYRGFTKSGMVYVHDEKEDVNQAVAPVVREATEKI